MKLIENAQDSSDIARPLRHTCGKEGCGASFEKAAHLKRHLLAHSNAVGNVDVDSVLDARRDDQCSLQMHANPHERPFACEHCGSAFKRDEHKTRHILLVHSTKAFRPTTGIKTAGPTEPLILNTDSGIVNSQHQLVDVEASTANRQSSTEPKYAVDGSNSHLANVADPGIVEDSSKCFKCHCCEKTFRLNYHLKRHLKTHLKLFKCNLCPETFARKRQLRRHMLLHLVNKLHSSQGEAVSQQGESVKVDGQPSFGSHFQDCPDKEVFSTENYASNHCSDSLHSSEGAQYSMDSVHGKRISASKRVQVSESEGSAHPEPKRSIIGSSEGNGGSSSPSEGAAICNRKRFSCPHENCGKVFQTLDQLYRHLKRTSQRQADYACQPCGASFHTFSALVAHRRTNHPSKSNICSVCGKDKHRGDDQTGDLIDRESPFKCLDCGAFFSSAIAILTSCHCEYSYDAQQKSNLRVHIRVKHLNERRFACDICGNTFSYKTVLRRHKLSIHKVGDADGKVWDKAVIGDATAGELMHSMEINDTQNRRDEAAATEMQLEQLDQRAKFIVDAVSVDLVTGVPTL